MQLHNGLHDIVQQDIYDRRMALNASCNEDKDWKMNQKSKHWKSLANQRKVKYHNPNFRGY